MTPYTIYKDVGSVFSSPSTPRSADLDLYFKSYAQNSMWRAILAHPVYLLVISNAFYNSHFCCSMHFGGLEQSFVTLFGQKQPEQNRNKFN
jgi:hypothetical protein